MSWLWQLEKLKGQYSWAALTDLWCMRSVNRRLGVHLHIRSACFLPQHLTHTLLNSACRANLPNILGLFLRNVLFKMLIWSIAYCNEHVSSTLSSAFSLTQAPVIPHKAQTKLWHRMTRKMVIATGRIWQFLNWAAIHMSASLKVLEEWNHFLKHKSMWMLVCVCTYMLRHTCGGQKTTLSQFFLSANGFPGSNSNHQGPLPIQHLKAWENIFFWSHASDQLTVTKGLASSPK